MKLVHLHIFFVFTVLLVTVGMFTAIWSLHALLGIVCLMLLILLGISFLAFSFVQQTKQ